MCGKKGPHRLVIGEKDPPVKGTVIPASLQMCIAGQLVPSSRAKQLATSFSGYESAQSGITMAYLQKPSVTSKHWVQLIEIYLHGNGCSILLRFSSLLIL